MFNKLWQFTAEYEVSPKAVRRGRRVSANSRALCGNPAARVSNLRIDARGVNSVKTPAILSMFSETQFNRAGYSRRDERQV
jgi:hypothetical protein